nr:MAG: RNA-dependent RNA polymerase [Rhizoctonia solani mitovirus 103]
MGPHGIFKYLKECQRRVIFYLADYKVTSVANAPYVKCDRHGLPTIIPGLLRSELIIFKDNKLIGKKGIVVCILSILSLFQVMSYKVRPNLASILDPFNGLVKTFELTKLRSAVKLLTNLRLKVGSPDILHIEKASPNSSKATWGAQLDAVAFIFYPKVFYHYSIMCLNTYKGGRYLLWVSIIMLVSFPIIILMLLVGGITNLKIAKLSVVYDKPGKARIVGITNYWIQVLLKPLHDGIFHILRNIPMDGTYDQAAPIHNLMSKVLPGQKYYSFDLSSATDRLPIEVQKDILNTLKPGLGSRWANLLGSLEWSWKSLNKRVPVRNYKYSVGQPMGAYSSWAMLALSHHIIVQLAALNVGFKTRFENYAVLGDDIVIADDTVAEEYLVLMRSLGVSINLSKSLISTEFCEFAKKWIGPGINLSPVGAGLLLQAGRTKTFLPSLLAQMYENDLINNFSTALAAIASLPPNMKGQERNALWAAFGLNSFLIKKGSQSGNAEFSTLLKWCFTQQGSLTSTLSIIKAAIISWVYKEKVKEQAALDNAVMYFLQNFWKTQCSSSWPNRMLEFLLKMLGPGVWSYSRSFIDKQLELDTIEDRIDPVEEPFIVDKTLSRQDQEISRNIHAQQGIVRILDNLPFEVGVAGIDWWNKNEMLEVGRRAKQIVAEFDELNSLINGVVLERLLGKTIIDYRINTVGLKPIHSLKSNKKFKPRKAKSLVKLTHSGVSATNNSSPIK